MDDVELWDLASRAPEALRAQVVERLADDPEQRDRVEALLAQPAPPRDDGPRYEILGLVGAGTQAEVYQARRLDLDRACALKVFRSVLDAAFVDRVRREAGLMARVLSPYVVTVFDAGDLGDGRQFIEMALCAEPDPQGAPGAVALGRSLRALVLERGPLAPDDAARLLQPICAAVAAAHRAGVVHSDVKPENVLVLPVSRRAMLADFGIAATVAQPRGGEARRVGTIAYMAPEQFLRGDAPDVASDAYGLGGTLLFALCGRPPHPDRREDGTDVRQGSPSPLPAGVPRALREVVERALAPDRAARPSADELAGALEAFVARRPTAWDLGRPRRRLALLYQRHRTMLNLAFLGAVVAATLGLGLLREVVIRTGLERRGDALAGRVGVLDGDVARLAGQKGALEAELARLRADREAIAGAEAREREARVRAEGRASEADGQLAASSALARETAGQLERAREVAAQLEPRLAAAEARVRQLQVDLGEREAELRASAERYQGSVDALRTSWAADAGLLRAELDGQREAAASLERRLTAAERDREAAVQARAELDARWQGRHEALRGERDELRRQLEAVKASAATTAPAPAQGGGGPRAVAAGKP